MEMRQVNAMVIDFKPGDQPGTRAEFSYLDASSILDDLLSQGLIYCDPSRKLNLWRPTPSALLALGLRSFTDISALKELEARGVV
jgi:hypothetical protein